MVWTWFIAYTECTRDRTQYCCQCRLIAHCTFHQDATQRRSHIINSFKNFLTEVFQCTHVYLYTLYCCGRCLLYDFISRDSTSKKCNGCCAVIHLSNVNHKCNVIRLKITRKNPQKASYCLSTCFHCLYHMQAYYLHVVFII